MIELIIVYWYVHASFLMRNEMYMYVNIFQVEKVYINLPNVHYFGVDFNRFPKIDFAKNDDNVS